MNKLRPFRFGVILPTATTQLLEQGHHLFDEYLHLRERRAMIVEPVTLEIEHEVLHPRVAVRPDHRRELLG